MNEEQGDSANTETSKPQQSKPAKEEPSMFESILGSPMVQTFGKTLMREGAKAIMGMIGLKKTTKGSKK